MKGKRSLHSILILGITFSFLSISSAQNLTSYQEALANSNQDDLVLRNMELGLASLQEQDYENAFSALNFVITDLESFYSSSEDAVNARSLWWEEGRKSFKGEPYERAMAYYYMGILYLQEGDYENARASFVSGHLQDSFAEEDQDRSDFALLMLLEYWSASLAGSAGLAEMALADLNQLRPDLLIPDPSTHALVILETGLSPRKLNDGVSGERLVFRRGRNFEDKYGYASLQGSGYSFNLEPIEDVYYQASTRGARAIDGVNNGKASYKQGWTDRSSAVANLANQFTLYSNLARDYSDYYSMQTYGASEFTIDIDIHSGEIAAAASLVSLIGSRFKAKADTRYWSNLPDTVHVGFVPHEKIAEDSTLEITLQNRSRSDMGSIAMPTRSDGEILAFYWSKVH